MKHVFKVMTVVALGVALASCRNEPVSPEKKVGLAHAYIGCLEAAQTTLDTANCGYVAEVMGQH